MPTIARAGHSRPSTLLCAPCSPPARSCPRRGGSCRARSTAADCRARCAVHARSTKRRQGSSSSPSAFAPDSPVRATQLRASVRVPQEAKAVAVRQCWAARPVAFRPAEFPTAAPAAVPISRTATARRKRRAARSQPVAADVFGSVASSASILRRSATIRGPARRSHRRRSIRNPAAPAVACRWAPRPSPGPRRRSVLRRPGRS